MITIKDIVELAKAGYKPNEVKELIELSKTEENNTPSISGSSDTAGEMNNPQSNNIQDSTPNPSFTGEISPAEETEKPETDYKALYEASQIELKEAQKANIKRDISSDDDNKSDEDILKDLIKEFI